jgi:hypothetical protein
VVLSFSCESSIALGAMPGIVGLHDERIEIHPLKRWIRDVKSGIEPIFCFPVDFLELSSPY